MTLQEKIGRITIADKTFAITGKLSKLRNEWIEIIEQHGGIYRKSVSRKTDYLLDGSSTRNSLSNKAQAAEKLGVYVITEDELMDAVIEAMA